MNADYHPWITRVCAYCDVRRIDWDVGFESGIVECPGHTRRLKGLHVNGPDQREKQLNKAILFSQNCGVGTLRCDEEERIICNESLLSSCRCCSQGTIYLSVFESPCNLLRRTDEPICDARLTDKQSEPEQALRRAGALFKVISGTPHESDSQHHS